MAVSLKQAEKLIDDKDLAEEEFSVDFDDIPSHIREARMQQLKADMKLCQERQEKQHGIYSDIIEEKAFFDLTTTCERCIVHFYKDDFRRCHIMHEHLEIVAKRHFETKFAKMNVERAKFLVGKLKIQILPTVLCFKNGIVSDRLIGFDELGNSDAFSTEVLETRLAKHASILSGDNTSTEDKIKNPLIYGHCKPQRDSDSDSDY